MTVRVDKQLRERLSGLSRRHAQEAIEQGLVRVPGEKLAKGTKLSGKLLDTQGLVQHLDRLKKGNPALKVPVVFEGQGFLIVDKPAGLAGHPLSLFDTDTVTHWVFAHYPQVASCFAQVQPTLTPHRLDTGTSGALIVCLSPQTYQSWRQRFSQKQVRKEYLAWCWGNPAQGRWKVDVPIGKASAKGNKRKVNGLESRAAVSEIQVEHRRPGKFLARVSCHTGVTHQVRVHLSSCGYPLIGDGLYDPKALSRDERPAFHLLRASDLYWADEHYQVDSTAFYQLF